MSQDAKRFNVALVQDWLVSRGGAERVLYDFHKLFPDAPIYTLVYDEEKAPKWCRECDIRTTYIQKWPGGKSHHKLLLSFMPKAWEALDLTEYDIVLSSCSSCCKGVITRPDALHICYCHSPIRYVWDLYFDYLRDAGPVKRFFMKKMIHKVRMWDYLAAQRVDAFVSNSDYVGERIRKYYRRDSVTVHPATPVRASEVCEPAGYYLVVSRFVRYKRVDIAIEACNKLGRKLVIVGSGGEEERRLRELAGPTVEFKGAVSDNEIEDLYKGADAFLFPGIEDFGLTPIEAMSSGVPVLALAKGGALETVLDGATGLLFAEQTPEAMAECILRFESSGVSMCREEIANQTMSRFSEERFMREIEALCNRLVKDARRGQ